MISRAVRKRLAEKTADSPISAVELFCGAGGLTHGLMRAGIKVEAGIDVDGQMEHAYVSNNPGVEFRHWDVARKNCRSIKNLFRPGKHRLLAGCAPCKPFSKLTNGMKRHEDWDLLDNFGRFVKGVLPELVTMENVPELADRGRVVVDRFIGTLERCGYHVDAQIVLCPEYGVPQARKRLVVLASRLGEISVPRGPYRDSSRWKTVRQTVADLSELESGEQDPRDRLHGAPLLSATNLKRIRATPHDGGTRDSWPDDLVLECHKKKSGERYPLRLDNVRQGFFTDEEVRAVLSHLPDWYAPAIEFAWRTGWRIGEVKGLTWSQVDFAAKTVRLEPGTTKNREGRSFPFGSLPALESLLRDQLDRTRWWQSEAQAVIRWVFWKDGRQLGDHRDTWASACRKAGLPGKLVHDLRRSAVRNLERAGVPRSSAMKLTGHKTESVYRRYAIVSEADLNEAVRRLASHQDRDGARTAGSTGLGLGKGTVQAHSGPSDGRSDDVGESVATGFSTGTHGPFDTSRGVPRPAARPATVPDDHAHWKLNPPRRPSTSRISPHR